MLRLLPVSLLFAFNAGSVAAQNSCAAQSAATITPVIELYTSEGCSSCPPADKWVSSLRTRPATGSTPVIQAFHVGYWDYIGWVDRFANPAHTVRQRQVASWNNQRSIYTPQAVLNGRDWRDWHLSTGAVPGSLEVARLAIALKQVGEDQFEAIVTPQAGVPGAWSAYWTVTEHGHSSKVRTGENAGEFLRHDYVVRQYTPAGDYRGDSAGPQKLVLRSIAASAGHVRQINLVIFDGRTGRTLQAVTAAC